MVPRCFQNIYDCLRIFSLAAIAYGLVITTFFTRAKTAATVGSILFYTTSFFTKRAAILSFSIFGQLIGTVFQPVCLGITCWFQPFQLVVFWILFVHLITSYMSIWIIYMTSLTENIWRFQETHLIHCSVAGYFKHLANPTSSSFTLRLLSLLPPVAFELGADLVAALESQQAMATATDGHGPIYGMKDEQPMWNAFRGTPRSGCFMDVFWMFYWYSMLFMSILNPVGYLLWYPGSFRWSGLAQVGVTWANASWLALNHLWITFRDAKLLVGW